MTMEAFDRRYETDVRRPFADLVPELPPIGRIGLMILIAGWSVLLVEPFVPMLADGRAGGFAVARLGQSAILTGAALAIVGLLMTIASRHTEAAVRHGPLPDLPGAADLDAHDDVAAAGPAYGTGESLAARAVATPVAAPAPQPPALPAAAAKPSSALQGLPTDGSMIVVARGQVDDRCFLVLADGSVVIETLLGQRRFKSLPDARDFIGGGTFQLHDTVQIPLTGGRMMATMGSTSEPAVKVPAARVLRHV
jgi:hypothetical protein